MRLCKGHTATAQGTITKAQRTSEKAQGTTPIDVGSFGYLMFAWLFFRFSCRVFRVGSVAAMDTVSQWDILNSCSHNIGLLWDWLCANVCHIQIIRPDLLHVALMQPWYFTTATTAIAVVAPTDCRNALQKPTAMIAVPFSHHCRRALPPENKLYSTLSKFENKPKSPDVCVNFTQRNIPQFHARKAQQQISGPLVVVLCVRQKNTRNIER